MNAHGHNSASYFDDETSGAFYSRELALPRGTNNSILKMCATVYLFSDPVTNGFSVTCNNNNYHNKILQTGFLGVYRSDHYITYTLVTNFPEISTFITGFSFTEWTKKSAKKIRKQVRRCLQNLYQSVAIHLKYILLVLL